MRTYKSTNNDAEINVTPMLDIVFIMLIFFIVTTSFVRERGLDISQLSKTPDTQEIPERPIVVKIDQANQLWIDERPIETLAVRANLERESANRPDAALIITAHEDAMTDQLVTVLDAANIVGIESISVATRQ